MGSNSMQAYNARGRRDLLFFHPDDLSIVDDESSPIHDPDRLGPADEELVQSIVDLGVLQPTTIRKNGDRIEVVAGRRRVFACREANRRRGARAEPILVPAVPRKGDDGDMFKTMVAENIRILESPIGKARKVKRYLDLGHSEEDAARLFGVSSLTITNWLALLDGSDQVQAAVEAGELAAPAARELARLPRAEQDAALEGMRANGTTRGEAGRAAATRAAKRKPAEAITKAPSRPKLRHLLAALEAIPRTEREDKTVGAIAVLELFLEGAAPRGGQVAAAWREVSG